MVIRPLCNRCLPASLNVWGAVKSERLPDSSRFWPAASWQPGQVQASYDKQFVRDWLTSPESGWDRGSDTEPPPLPAHIVEKTRERYVQAYEQLTGEVF